MPGFGFLPEAQLWMIDVFGLLDFKSDEASSRGSRRRR